MITSVFGKSKPINFILCAVILLAYFVMFLFSEDKVLGVALFSLEVPVLFLLLFSLFVIDFIVKKNDLTKQNDFALFFATIFMGFLPSIFESIETVCMYILILFAFRRVITLGSLRSVKQKIFDAAFLIGLAVLFDFWMVIYIGMVYLGILLYVSGDYRNWLAPIVGFSGVIALYITYLYLTEQDILTNPLFQFEIQIDYSETNFKRIVLHSVIVTLFFLNFVILLLKYKTYSSQKKLSFLLTKALFFIGIVYALFTKNTTQNPELLLLFPLAIFMANSLENIENKRVTDAILVLLMVVSFLFNIYP